MNETIMMYVIDREYRILYANRAFRENYPEISCGQKCYQALGHIEFPCGHCPVQRSCKKNTFYNEATGEWVKAQMAEVEWEGRDDCYAVFVQSWKETDEEDKDKLEQLTEEVRLQRELLLREQELKAQQNENIHRLAMIQALSRDYGNVYCVDLSTDTFEVYRLENYLADEVQVVMKKSKHSYSRSISAYISDCVHEEDREKMTEALEIDRIRKRLEGKDSFVCNYRTVRNGTVIYYQVKCVSLQSEVDEGKVIVGFRDVDEEMRLEMEQKQNLADAYAQAEYASQAKTTFLNNMSHDIRTPMNAILGMTAIAAMRIDDKERVLDALNKISLSGKHLLGLINSVLDMSKIESGKISLNEEEFCLSDSIESLIALFHAQMLAKNLELKVNIAEIAHENVIGDAQRLQQIFVNIMGNAIKFTPAGGSVTVSIREKNSELTGRGCYEFVFEDTGIGMEKEFIDRIFEPFARAADSRTSKIEGTGLGMSIAVNVARMMGGDIQVESELGKGSRFTVTVYLKVNDDTEENLQMLVSLPVLVVDDEETACESACEILNSLEMQAEYVLDGDSAVERVTQAHHDGRDFAVVILDWKMPGKDGLETAREIRQVVGNSVPIIILSAYDWSSIEQEAVLAGVNAFIEKPLFKSRLTHVLKDVLGPHNNDMPREAVESFQKQDHRNRRVLLVEDNELNVEVASELLHVAGIEVETAYNGSDAVEAVSKKPAGYFDLIFMDIQMPEMNGYEATRQIRALGRSDLQQIPVIAMTADAFEEDIRKAREAGMNGHIAKPIDLGQLEKTIEEWI